MTYLAVFTPYDSLALRDGRPFEQDDQGLAETTSVFPPYPPTFAGALKSAAGVHAGFPEGLLDWHQRYERLLSDVSDGTVRYLDSAGFSDKPIAGPFLYRHSPKPQIYVPCPATLLFDKADQPHEAIPIQLPRTALSDVAPSSGASTIMFRKPCAGKAESFDPANGRWICARTLRHLLIHGVDDLQNSEGTFIYPGRELRSDPRIGVGLSWETGRAEASQLFQATYTTMDDDLSLAMMLADDGASLSLGVVRLGGEGRFGEMKLIDADLSESPPPFGSLNLSKEEKGLAATAPNFGGLTCFRLVAISPVPVSKTGRYGLDLPEELQALGFETLGAATGKPSLMSFFDPNDVGARIPVTQTFFPAGSTWVVGKSIARGETKTGAFDELFGSAKSHSLCIDSKLAQLGFGAFVAGLLPRSETNER